MYLDRASLEVQAGIFNRRNLPRLTAEAIAAGHDGEVLRLMASLIGERREVILAAAESVPNIERRLLVELDVPERSPVEAAWELARKLARDAVAGDVAVREAAAGELTALAREVDDRRLNDEVARLEGLLDQWEWIPPKERDEETRSEVRRIAGWEDGEAARQRKGCSHERGAEVRKRRTDQGERGNAAGVAGTRCQALRP